MEPPQAALETIVKYIVVTRVLSIKWLDDHPEGWFVHFEGSRESLNFGLERPVWEVGDVIEISFHKKEPHA